jgi:hypothetical protein
MATKEETAALKKIQGVYEQDGQSDALRLAYKCFSHLGVSQFCCGCESETLFIDNQCCVCGGAVPARETPGIVKAKGKAKGKTKRKAPAAPTTDIDFKVGLTVYIPGGKPGDAIPDEEKETMALQLQKHLIDLLDSGVGITSEEYPGFCQTAARVSEIPSHPGLVNSSQFPEKF